MKGAKEYHEELSELTNHGYVKPLELEQVAKINKEINQLYQKKGGDRYNTGKLRWDLLHPVAQEGIVRVLTKGAIKYAPRNWEKGLGWTGVIASLKRHLAAIERGEDHDPESGELHIDHVQCNAHFLSAYYKIAPQFDDRQHGYLYHPKIGLDIDEVICDFTAGWGKLHNIDVRPECWNYHRDMGKEFKKLQDEGKLEEFYLSLEPKVNPNDLPFEPHCYVTSRPIDTCITEQWLEKHKFPGSKVLTVPLGASKVDALKEAGVEVFVDDAFHNFTELNKAGITCYLFDAPHNRRYNVGYKRIKSLKELI